MHVLVCDDDASTRFAAKRLLEDHFGCMVQEAADGAEALTALAQKRFTLLLLDLDMPGLNGHDTLEEIRASDLTRSLPVIVLSNERREEVIVRLMRLGVAEYILKPLRASTFVGKIEALVRSLPRATVASGDLESILVKPDAPAIIADGNLDFRFFFNSQVSRYGPVLQAESGAAALAAFRRSPVSVVFVGAELGVVSAERLAQKIREMRPSGVRIVRLVDQADATVSDLFDGTLKRSYMPEAFRDAVRPFVFIPGPLWAVRQLVPNLSDVVDGVTAQVFGMMFAAEVVKSKSESAFEPAFSATLDLPLQHRFNVRVGVHLPRAAAVAVTGHMLGMPGEELGDEDLQSVAGELSNLLAGRIHARFRERNFESTVGLPTVSVGPTFVKPDEGNGTLHRYTLPAAGDFLLSIIIRDHLDESNTSKTDTAAGKPEGVSSEAA